MVFEGTNEFYYMKKTEIVIEHPNTVRGDDADSFIYIIFPQKIITYLF